MSLFVDPINRRNLDDNFVDHADNRPQITWSAALNHTNHKGQGLIVCGFSFRELTCTFTQEM